MLGFLARRNQIGEEGASTRHVVCLFEVNEDLFFVIVQMNGFMTTKKYFHRSNGRKGYNFGALCFIV